MKPVPAPRPQLTLEELQQVRWFLGGVLSILGVATVAFMEVDAWWLMLATMAAAALTTLWPQLPARVPRSVNVLAFPFIAAFFALDLWLRSELLPAMVRLDMLLLLYRAVVYRQRRDDLQVIVLGLFLVVVAGVLTVSLAFAVQILAYTACALLFLLTLTLTDVPEPPGAAAVESAVAGRPATPVPAWAAHVQWRRLFVRILAATNWRVAALSGAMFVGLIAITALLFLSIPRFQLDNGMFLERFVSKRARTGFSDAIKFGDVTEIQQDTSVALHVDVSDPEQIPLAPYWRMLVLNDYRDGIFRISPAVRAARFSPERVGVSLRGTARPRTGRTVWTFYLEAGVSRYLPLLGPFRTLRFGEAQSYRQSSELDLIALAKDPVTMTAYQVEGFELGGRLHEVPESFYGARSGGVFARGTLDLADDGELKRLAVTATGAGDLDAATFAARLCTWLRERHPYSLSPRIPDGRGDPLVRWAGSTNGGHCELFAGSFVLIARAAGFPARVVTGFRGGTWNAFSNSFTVRNSDAHAWAEIYDRGSGTWLRADPLENPAAAQSAEAGGTNALARRTDRSWGARLDSLRIFWYRRIVSFDEQAQVRTVRALKEATVSAAARLRERLDRAASAVRRWWSTPWDAGRVASVLTLSLVVAALAWGWRSVRYAVLQFSWSRRRDPRRDPVRREAGRWLRRLAERPAATAAAADVLPDLQRLRYGPRETWPDPLPVFRRARGALRPGRRGAAVNSR